jgi:ATP-binding cassette subfamily B protein
VVDKGFARGSDPATINHWFLLLEALVAVLAIGTAIRFYNVSWLGERVVADIRLAVQRTCCASRPASSRRTAPRKSPAA